MTASGRVVWTENVWCVFRVKPPSSIFSGLVWTERNICFVPGFKSRFQTRFVKPKPKYPLCYAIGLEYLRHFLIQSEVKPKPLVTRSHAFFPRFSSAAVFALGFGWFTVCIYIHTYLYTVSISYKNLKNMLIRRAVSNLDIKVTVLFVIYGEHYFYYFYNLWLPLIITLMLILRHSSKSRSDVIN